jgi:hypothetical protein
MPRSEGFAPRASAGKQLSATTMICFAFSALRPLVMSALVIQFDWLSSDASTGSQ